MRLSTAFILAALILAVVFFGVLQTIGFLVAAFATLVLLFFATLFVGAWLLKRRMRRKLAELRVALDAAAREQRERRRDDAMRRDAIDADFAPGGRHGPR